MNECTPKDIAKFFGINTETVRTWLKSGKIKGVKLGKLWKISDEEFEKLKKNGTK